MDNSLELLAPAGNFESFYAAINNGANAVYLGLSDFNARMKADNFNTSNIKEVCDYAHLRNVKVYVTVNILIKDEEYDSLLDMIEVAYKANVDAFLIQDLAVAAILKKNFPGICLHASTQLGIHNLNGALVAQKLGFSRIVLSRETTEDDIKEIKDKTNLEIEYFIQGALCVSFSGNCYLSSFKTLNSGNRGRCQQLCRLKYQSFSDDTFVKSGYLLSPRDLCLIKDIEHLKNLGVKSLKIEGRLRRPGYVSTAVKTYRKIIDLIEKGKTPYKLDEDILNLRKVFSRGDFNYHAYLHKSINEEIINSDIQNHLGVKIGKTISCRAFKDIYRLEVYSSHHELTKGDGLKFISNNKEVGSVGVGNVEKLSPTNYVIYSKNKILNGTDIYLTLDNRLEEENLNNKIYRNISIYCYALIDGNLVVVANSEDYSYTYSSSYVVPKAIKNSTTKEEIIAQLSKVNDYDFKVKDIEVECDDVFIPKSILNEARREACLGLQNVILGSYHTHKDINKNKVSCISLQNKPTYFKDIFIINEKIKLDVLKKFDLEDKLICFSFEDYKQAEAYIEYVKSNYSTNDFALNLPIINNKNDLKIIEKLLNKYNFIVIANNVSHLNYLNKYDVIAGLGLNVLSQNSINNYLNMGCKNVIISLEASKEVINNNKECYYYSIGYNTLMNFAHCPYKVNYGNTCVHCSFNDSLIYQNESKEQMKIRRIKISQCYFELLNSKLLDTYSLNSNNKLIDLRTLNNEELDEVNKVINYEKENVVSSYTGLFSKVIK